MPSVAKSFRLYSIEGNIGAGKTTILANLERRFAGSKTVVFLREPVELWDTFRDENGEAILTKFYKDPKKFAFAFQVMAYSTRLSMLRELIRANPACEVVICERSLEADRHIFAKMLHDDKMIDDIQFQIYETFFKNSADDYMMDGIVYINARAETCFERVAKRARVGESAIELAYLTQCGQYHDAWLKSGSTEVACPVLEIDANASVSYGESGSLGETWIKECMEFFGIKVEEIKTTGDKDIMSLFDSLASSLY